MTAGARHKIIAATILLAVALIAAMFHFRSKPETAAALCGGSLYTLSYSGGTPHIDIEIGGAPARAMLDYGATKSSLRTKTPADVGYTVKMETSLPLVGESEFLSRHTDPDTDAILGTDLLGRFTVALDARTAAISTKPCAASSLKAAGFAPIDQRGFFAPDRTRVAKDRPNVPVVFIQLGDTKTWAQIDTGYDDDLYPYSLDINQPFYNELMASGVTLTPEGFVTVRTCAGFENRPIYSSAQSLVITNEAGTPITETRKYYLIVKPANICGGIANRTTPAAQLGSSFMNLFQSVVFDPNGQMVWLKKN
jgi:hypothetical protein